MNASELLLAQTQHHYQGVLRSIADVDAHGAGTGDRSLKWQLEHLLHEVETTGEALAGLPRDPEMPSDWEELGARFERSARANWEAFQGLDPMGALAVPVDPAFQDRIRCRADWWRGHLFHLAYHLGQIGRWRAEAGLPWGGGSGVEFP